MNNIDKIELLHICNGSLSGYASAIFRRLTKVFSVSLILALLFVTPLGQAFSQTNTQVSGTVKDAVTQEPMVGVNIFVKGTTSGVSTDENGQYSLNVTKADAILVVSFIGYETQEIQVSGQSVIDVLLLPEINTLDEIVVVAYGTTSRSNLTGSAVAISSEELKDVFTPNLSTMLQGKVAGVYAQTGSGRPGTAPTINIRGKGSINTTNSPLWVVDGIIVGHSEPTINPADVESVTVLKDASATSLYGSRASNGVILVQTKRSDTEISEVTASVTRGFTDLSMGKFSLMNSQQLYNYQLPWNVDADFNEDLLAKDTDWLDLATQIGDAQEYNVAYKGGTEKISSYISGTYYNETGAVKGYDFERYSAIANLDIKATDRLTIKTNLSGNMTLTENQEHSLYSAYTYMPWDSPYLDDGTPLLPELNPDIKWWGRDQSNYLYNLQYNWGKGRSNNFRFNVGADFKITEWLTFTSMNNIYFGFGNSQSYNDPRSTSGWANNGSYTNGYTFTRDRLSNQLLRFNNTYGDHTINAFAAWEYSDTYYDSNSATGKGVAAGLTVLNTTSEPESISGGRGESARQSLLFSTQYVFDSRYMATASFRREGSSSFGPDNKYGNFWSVSAGWNMHNESFMQDIDWLNVLKVTASYGLVGNSPSHFPFLTYYELTGQYAGFPAARPYQKGNPAITWETSKTANFGVETRLFNRITASIDIYQKNSSRLLYYVPLPALSGYNGIWDNIGEIKNQGFELSISPEIIKTKDFIWNMTFNLSYNNNEVVSLYQDQPISGFVRIEEGYDMDSYYTRIWHGVNPGNGDPFWEKVVENEDGTQTVELTNNYNDATLQFTGTKRTPDFIGGIINQISYKGITLSANIGFVEGLYLYHSDRELFDSDGAYPTFNNMNLADGWSRWQQPGDMATHPLAQLGGNRMANSQSSRYLEDASYIRLRNLNLSYQLPNSISSRIKVNKATVFINADNLVTITKWSGTDPETATMYPLAKKYLLGFRIDF